MHKMVPRRMKRLCITFGFICVGLGAAGIVLPLLPTTPFILLAAVLFSRSSPRFHSWLLNHRIFGPTIRGYVEKRGIPLKTKLFSICLVWVTIFFSIIFAVDNILVRGVLCAVALGVSFHIGCQKTAPGL
jgi:uncharacterized membrane protein YbaN (DUF454 family)